MPVISMFYGIIIRMYMEVGAPHHLPHFHAYYQDDVAIFSLDPIELIAGEIPRRQRRLRDHDHASAPVQPARRIVARVDHAVRERRAVSGERVRADARRVVDPDLDEHRQPHRTRVTTG